MNFFAWLVLGLVAYTSGFSIRHFRYKDAAIPTDKKWQYAAIFFVLALVVFALLNLYVMHKAALDMMFVLVSSLVATGVFYYGISADTNNKMNIPD